MGELSRRDFIKGAGLLPLAAALPSGFLLRAMAASHPYRFFTEHQAAVVIEATARLIPGPQDDPSETGHPGAREANVVRYVDTMLAAFTFHPPKVHAGGPFSDRAGAVRDDMQDFVSPPRIRLLGWKRRIAQLHKQYVAGIKQLDDMAGGDFTKASPDQQDQILIQTSDFRDVLFTHAIEGMYAVPEYGGNQGLVGWQDIEFPGDTQPRGYSAKQVSQSDGPDPVSPGAVARLGLPFEDVVALISKGLRRG